MKLIAHSLFTGLCAIILLSGGALSSTNRYLSRRQDESIPTTRSTSAALSASPSSTAVSESRASLESTPSLALSKAEPSTTTTEASETVATLENAPSASGQPYNSSTDLEESEQLPIQPKITPAVGIAGALLMLTGLVYTLLGIQKKWIYVSFSVGYLFSLAVTVLIVYVMDPPVRDAIQGAYLVAAIVTGVFFGGIACIFSDITQGLGCLLGGYSLSMWLLTLRSGGLIQSVAGKAILIGVFSLVAFSFSFSSYTRSYALVVSMSFSGATVIMLGIDCFTRAGLKEFWLYLWDLSPKSFPINTTNYPLTRGIKAEVALIILIFLMGAMSQFKLLNVIKRRRAKKELDRQRHAEMREQEENEIGRRMQQDLVKEVAQWENLYGNKSRAEACDSSITESDGSQKYSNSADQLHKSHGHDIELADMPQAWSGPSSGATSRRISDTLGAQSNGRSTRPVSVNRTQSGQNSGPSTRPVSVNRNQSVPSSGANTRPVSAYQSLPVQSNDPTMRPVSMNRSQSTPRVSEKGTSTRNGLLRVSTASVSRNTRGDDRNSIAVGPKQSSARSSVRLSSSSPAILPLPLAAIQRRSRVEEEQASISTAQESTQEVRHGIKRISGASAFKRLSTVSSRPDPAESQEDLIPSADDNDNDDDRASSIAATLDEEEILDSAASALSLPLSVVEEGSGSQKDAADRAGQGSQSSGGTGTHPSGPGATDHATEESSETLLSAGPQIEISKDGSEGKWLVHGGLSKAENKIEDGEERIKAGNRSKRPKSGVSVAQSDAARPVSASGSLKEHLPDKLSKAAMLYRTNEWTKGWEVAEAPEEDRLSRSSSPGIQIDPAFVYAAQAEANKPIVSPVVDMRDHVEVPGLVRQSLVRPSSAEPFHRNSKNMSGLRTSYSNAPFPELQRPSLALHAHANQRLAGLSQQNVHVRANLGKRMSSAPLMLSGALQPAIDEANEASFARSSTPTLHLPASLRLSQSASPMLLPRASNTSLNQQSRFSGDLQSFDSHQPKGHSGFDAQRRDTNLAVWRSSMSQLNRLQTPIVDDGRRTAMIQEQRMRQMEEMQKKSVAAYRNSVFDVQMRSGNMIGAHRDVLRRMQEKANKNA